MLLCENYANREDSVVIVRVFSLAPPATTLAPPARAGVVPEAKRSGRAGVPKQSSGRRVDCFFGKNALLAMRARFGCGWRPRYILTYTNVHLLSIASACQELQKDPSDNRLRGVLKEALPDRPNVQCALNKIFHRQLPSSVWKYK